MSLGTPERVRSLDDGEVIFNHVSPFLPGAPCLIEAAAGSAATVYRASHPGTADESKYWRIKADGINTVFTAPDALDDLDGTAIAGLDATNRLLVVALANGVPLVRVGSDGTPGAGEFAATDVDEITFGDTHDFGVKLEVFAFSVDDVTDSGSVAAGAIVEESCADFYTASAPAFLQSAM